MHVWLRRKQDIDLFGVCNDAHTHTASTDVKLNA